MRSLIAATLVAVPALAAAEPKLTCGFDGAKTIVTIVNPESKDVQCNYACHYRMEDGSVSISGFAGVKAGETKMVDEDTRRSKVASVRESSLKCE